MNDHPFKYLEAVVSRSQSTTIFVRVPKDFENKQIYRLSNAIEQAVEETTGNSEWENELHPEYDVNELKEIPRDEAEKFQVFDLTQSRVVSDEEKEFHQMLPRVTTPMVGDIFEKGTGRCEIVKIENGEVHVKSPSGITEIHSLEKYAKMAKATYKYGAKFTPATPLT